MDYSVLSDSPIFKGLSEAAIDTILQDTAHRIRKYQTGSMIAQSGEQVNSLMIILSGVTKGEMVDYSGKIIKIEDIPAPGALASAFLFGNKNRYPVNVIALTDTVLLIIDKADFLKILMVNNQILINFLDIISNRSQFLSEKIKFLSFKTIKSKLAQYILRLADGNRKEVRLDLTQNDLADFFGVARPSIARTIRELEEDGLVKAEGKRIVILNKKGLGNLTVD